MAFYDCSSLTDINYNETAVRTAPTAFVETAWYNSQPDGIVYYGKSACAYKGDFKANETIKDGTVVVADGLFYGDEELTSIDIADSVEYIGSMAFEECINLREVNCRRVYIQFVKKHFTAAKVLKVSLYPML